MFFAQTGTVEYESLWGYLYDISYFHLEKWLCFSVTVHGEQGRIVGAFHGCTMGYPSFEDVRSSVYWKVYEFIKTLPPLKDGFPRFDGLIIPEE